MSFQLGQRYIKWLVKPAFGDLISAVIVQVVALDRSHVTVKCVQVIGYAYSWRVDELSVLSHEHMTYHFEYMKGQDRPELRP
jgi:hypothetical protein